MHDKSLNINNFNSQLDSQNKGTMLHKALEWGHTELALNLIRLATRDDFKAKDLLGSTVQDIAQSIYTKDSEVYMALQDKYNSLFSTDEECGFLGEGGE